MTLPTFESFMYPVLKNSTSEVRVTELAEVCAKELNLTEEDKQERTRKLRQVKYVDRTWWSVTYLSQAKLLKRVRRGYYKITDYTTTSPRQTKQRFLPQLWAYGVFFSF